MRCDINKPCEKFSGKVCYIDSGICIKDTHNKTPLDKGVLEINFLGKKFLSRRKGFDKLKNHIINILLKKNNFICDDGRDFFMAKNFKNKALSELQKYEDIISFVDTSKENMPILCVDKFQLKNQWSNQYGSYEGFVVRYLVDDEKEKYKTMRKQVEKLTRTIKKLKFFSLPFWHNIFVSEKVVNGIFKSKCNIFALVSTNLRYVNNDSVITGGKRFDIVFPVKLMSEVGKQRKKLSESSYKIEGQLYPQYHFDITHSPIEPTDDEKQDFDKKIMDVEIKRKSGKVEYSKTSRELLKIMYDETNQNTDPINELIISFYNDYSLPVEIGYLTNLKKLVIKSAQIKTLPNSIGMLVNLREIFISNCSLRNLPNTIENLKKLKIMEVRLCELEEINENLGKCRKLSVLQLSYNKIKEIPDEISIPSIETLDLSHNELKEIPDTIDRMVNLADLNMNNNPIKKIPDAFCNLKHLRFLNLCETKITKLPENFGKLTHIETLDISHSNLFKLPESMRNMINIKHFNLSANRLRDGFLDLSKLEKLIKFNMEFNQLTKFPIICSQYIEDISLFDNKIERFSKKAVEGITSVVRLDLRGNRLKNLPDNIGELKNLKYLLLDRNNISELPISIVKLKNLIELNIFKNKLARLPENIHQLKNLEQLDLKSNTLQDLPENISRLPNLRVLVLDSNKLKTLPESFGNFNKLENLFLSRNRLKKLPIFHMKTLKLCNVDNNNFTDKNIPEIVKNFCKKNNPDDNDY